MFDSDNKKENINLKMTESANPENEVNNSTTVAESSNVSMINFH